MTTPQDRQRKHLPVWGILEPANRGTSGCERVGMSEADTAEHDARDRRIGQLLNEYLDLRARGKAEPQGQWLAKHPDLADELRSHLELVGGLQSERATLEGLIAQGLLEPCDDEAYPARLAEYKVSAVLGRGGMGIVLEAYDESLHRAVALKVLRPELADDRAALTRFTREARAAAALQHPNIVTVYAVGQHGLAHYLAMEYVDGPTLADTIRDGWPVHDPPVAAGVPAGRKPPVAADRRVGRSPVSPGVPTGLRHLAQEAD